MRQYVYKFVVVSILFVLLVAGERYWNNKNNKYVEPISVVVTNQNIKKGVKIDESMIKYIEVSKTELNENLIINIDNIIGKYPRESMKINQYVYEYQFTDKQEYDLEENERIITLKLSIEQSNGWHIKKDQIVDLILINEKESIQLVIEDIKIEKIFNDQLYDIEDPFSSEFVPQYASFVLTKIQLLLYLKNITDCTAYISVK